MKKKVRKHSEAVEMVPIGELTLIDNPRLHPEREVESIVSSVKKYGFMEPVKISGEDNTLISGYARVEACRRLGWTSVPALRLDLEPVEYRTVMILANRLPEMASWDYQMFINMVETELDQATLSLPDIAFTEEEFSNIRAWQDDVNKGGLTSQDFLDKSAEKEEAPEEEQGEEAPQARIEIVLSYPEPLWDIHRAELDTDLAGLAVKFPGLRFSQPKKRKATT